MKREECDYNACTNLKKKKSKQAAINFTLQYWCFLYEKLK